MYSLPPSLDDVLNFLQRLKPVRVDALCPEDSIKRLAEGVVRGLAPSGEVDLHFVAVSPQVHQLTGELAAVVAEQYFSHTARQGTAQRCSIKSQMPGSDNPRRD